MKEFDNREPETADEWMDHISEFAHKWELGSSEHCAVNDFLNLQNLYNRFGEESRGKFAERTGKSQLSPEDRKNLDLQKIALLEHTIEQNQARIPRYSNAYVHLVSSFDYLLGTAAKEAEIKFSGDNDKQKEHVQNIYNEALGYAYQDVFERQNTEL